MNTAETATKGSGLATLTSYRPFIDGLRAVSILLVVFYHSGVPGITGGFIGVDVFFVISGFLIINQIRTATEAGTFSFADFWSRRAVRILPPYLLVIGACILVAPFVLFMPEDFTALGQGVFHSAVMDINHFYWRLQGYFDRSSDSKVLLSLWSLAVEEQFYLVAPITIAGIYVIARKMARPARLNRWVLALSLPLLCLSLAGCILLTQPSRNYAFFFTPLRAWQFMAGGCIAYIVPSVARLDGRVVAGLGIAGLAAILLSATMFSSATLYPSAYAVLPVIGAVLVIVSGIADETGPSTRFLSSRPMVSIGLVSYAWYLWHWPLLAFMRINQFGERIAVLDAAMVLLSLVLAIATWHLIERPLRKLRHAKRGKLGWMPLLAGICTCLAVAFGGSRFLQAEAQRILSETPPVSVAGASGPIHVCDLMVASTTDCLAFAGGKPTGLVIGDSHALAAEATMSQLAQANGSALTALVREGCVGIIGAKMFELNSQHESRCAEHQARGQALLSQKTLIPDYALIASRWISYAGSEPKIRFGDPAAYFPAADQPAYFIASMRATLSSLHAMGVQRIAILGPLPSFTRRPPDCLSLARRYQMDLGTTCGTPRAREEAIRRTSLAQIMAAADGLPYVRVVDPTGEFCDDSICLPFDGDTILYGDADHISVAGMDRIVSRHRDDFDWLVGPARP